MGPIMIAGIAVIVILLLLMSVTMMWKKVPQDKAMVITGWKNRVITGGGGFVIPLLERTDTISLENIKLSLQTAGAMTSQGVKVRADGIAVIKVKSDPEAIRSAVEQFYTGKEKDTIDKIRETATDVLEGKLREIVAKLSVEELYKERDQFANQVQTIATEELDAMGIELKIFTIKEIDDDNGYLESLGKKRIAEVKRDAEIAEAEAQKESNIKKAEAIRLGKEAQLVAETQIAEAEKEKNLKIQAYRKEQETAKADADAAYQIKQNIMNKDVVTTKLEADIIQKQKETELAEKDAIRMERELEATVIKQADAEKYRIEKIAEAKKFESIQQSEAEKIREVKEAEARAEAKKIEGFAEAEAVKAKGTAEADAVKAKGLAEAEAVKARGLAEAEAMQKKAEAYKNYGDAALVEMIVQVLPQVAREIAQPLTKVDKITLIDSGSGNGGLGTSKITDSIVNMTTAVPQLVKDTTGIDIIEVVKARMGVETMNDALNLLSAPKTETPAPTPKKEQ